ncbi:thiamine biosynthesis protein ApbE [Variovorax defluvii]|uniref:Thiamine biosynthesis protein ApbE n=1 Tax=Variovorax defluvii TaxID=913761 RepID=A0ABP8IGZ9_9BURK
MTAQRSALEGGRWHFNHGPIDIVAEAHGDAVEVAVAHEHAWRRFATVLDELVAELPLLRQPVRDACPLRSPIARRMWQACAPFRASFITPMAAVAGAVAQELIACYQRSGIERAWINNGGDIALHLAPGQSARVGLFADLARFDLRERGPLTTDGQFELRAEMPVRGVATSGWRGRSFSLGIADSVTVLAATAAEADAAATVIANAVDVQDPGIHRRPANECKDDSDLGDIPVTVDVEALAPAQVQRALAAGVARAETLRRAGAIAGAMLVCQGQWRLVEPLSSASSGVSALPMQPQAAAVGSVFA